jgi:soluble lytic murein transglycosylase-like protein
MPFAAQIDAAAQKYGLDPALLRGLIKQESGFNPNAGSPAGAQGLTQLMPGTARSLGCTNPLDPNQAIDAGAKYLRQQLDAFGGDVRKALAAYNAGPGAVQRYGGVPPYGETQNYVQKVMAYADEYRRAGSPAQAMQAAGQAGSLSYPTT